MQTTTQHKRRRKKENKSEYAPSAKIGTKRKCNETFAKHCAVKIKRVNYRNFLTNGYGLWTKAKLGESSRKIATREWERRTLKMERTGEQTNK